MNPELKSKIVSAQRLHGWCGLEKAERLALLILDAAPQITVEIGVYGAKSLVPMALAAQQYGGAVFGIDPWTNAACLEGTNAPENDEWWGKLDIDLIYRSAVDAVHAFKLSATVELMRMTDTDAIIHFPDESIGVLHVDGNHSPEVSRRYIEQWGPKIKHGGYLIMDDTDWPTQAETVKLIESQYQRVTVTPSWAIYRKD